MKCPHCSTVVYLDYEETTFPQISDDDYDNTGYSINRAFCPECNKLVVTLQKGTLHSYYPDYSLEPDVNEIVIYPKFPNGIVLDSNIPSKYRDVYREAEQVNEISPRASATLSRYLLQMILHEELKIKKRNLEEEIVELESQKHIPSMLVTLLQVMRRVANFAAHPKKSTNSVEIVEVEKGESAIMLELLNELLDFVFVKPVKEQEFLQKIEDKYGIKS